MWWARFALPTLRLRPQSHVNILLLCEREHLVETFLAPDARLLHAAEGHAEEMLADLVDPNESGLHHRGGAVRDRDVIGPDRAREAVFDHVHLVQHLGL